MLIFGALCITLLLTHYVYAEDSNCDFMHNVEPGREYSLTYPNDTDNYLPKAKCRWIGVCPTGYNCRLDCPSMSIHYSDSCSSDRLLVSKSGDPELNDASVHCGDSSLSVVSHEEQISVGLIASRYSPGGNISCYLRAQESTRATQCRCGQNKRYRIVGGEATQANEYNMMVGSISSSWKRVKCGGVLISDKHVLTAAHCLLRDEPSNIFVLVGDHDLSTGNDTSSAKLYPTLEFKIHPEYSELNSQNDIAIVVTIEEIIFNENVGPVCLPFRLVNRNFTGSVVTVLGWGFLDISGPTSDTLRKVDLDVISLSTCRRYEPVIERQICTLTPEKDSCQFDSGGPLLYTDPSTGLLFNKGIISYGKQCADDYPAINTRVTAYLPWIVVTTEYSFCII